MTPDGLDAPRGAAAAPAEAHDADAQPIVNVSRRAFLLGLGVGALVLAVAPALAADPPRRYGGDGMPGGLKDDPRLFVAIAADGTVTILNHRAEMGQGVRTSVPMIIADELEADWARVQVRQAPGDEARYGNQNTDGSRSIRHNFEPLRRAGAAARQMLIAAAAASWKVPAADIVAEQHVLTHAGSGRRAGYGEFAAAAAALPVPSGEALKLKQPAQFRYIGKGRIGGIDNRDIVSGKAQYGIDTRVPGMVYAVVARPPVYGGRVKRHDAAAALKVPGVLKVVPLDGAPIPSAFFPLGGVAVVAENTWAAIEGRKALQIEWDHGPNAGYDSQRYRAALETASRAEGQLVYERGATYAELAKAERKIAVEYYVPHLAHAPMEPPAAVVRADADGAEAWACVQAPQATRDLLAGLLKLPEERVTIHQTLLGGGFGRKSKPDFVAEAAVLSRALDGKPVKLTWTREDDIVNDYFHTVSLERIEAAVDAAGKPLAWLHRSAAPSIASLFGPDPKHQRDFELGQGLTDLATAVPHYRVENPEAPAHTRIGWFRSVYNIPHAFATQSAVAELAHAAGRDPKDFLLDFIGPARRIDPVTMKTPNYGEDPARYPLDAGRLRRVAEVAAQGAGWGRTLPRGKGLGIAAHRSFVSYVAVVVEVEVGDDGTLSIPRVDIAVDCGPQVNPERVRSQMEGAVIQGLGLAATGEIRFAEGRAVQSNFHDYLLPRIDAAPRAIHVHAVGADDYALPLGGVGEPGLPPVAPALTNAIFAATGKRIRSLPIGRQLAGWRDAGKAGG